MYIASNFPDTRANGGLFFIGHLLPSYDESMPVYRTAGGGYYSFDPSAVCFLFTPNSPIGADQTGWLYRSATMDITSAWTDRTGNPAGTVS